MPVKPQVVAHRGASDTDAEHTLGAYRRALAEGADALECDVRLTADGHLVLVHDRRLERTSDGVGIVSTSTLEQLWTLDFESWKHPWRELDDEVVETDPETRRILTLPMLLALVRDCGRRVELAIETKHPTRYAGLVEQRLVECLEDHGLARPEYPDRSPVRVMSFSQLSLRRIRDLAPGLPTVTLVEHRIPVRWRTGELPVGCRAVGVSVKILREQPGQLRRLIQRGHPVHVYTVNEPDDVDRSLDAGVVAIITDRPAQVRAQVDTRCASATWTRRLTSEPGGYHSGWSEEPPGGG